MMMDMQKTSPEQMQSKIFEELKELEEERTKEALELVQRKHKLIKCEGETGQGNNSAKIGGLESNRSMVWCLTTIPLLVGAHPPWLLTQMKRCLLPHRNGTRRADEAKSESSWTALQKGRKEAVGALTWRVKWRSWKLWVRGPGLKADLWIPKRRWVTDQLGVKAAREERWKAERS